ncbi:MAG: methyltransferase [Pseudomonadota bacterium]
MFGPTAAVRELDDPLHITRFRPDHDRITAARARTGLTADPASCDLAVVCLPRNRTAGLNRIAEACAAVRPGGTLVVDGQKTDGIEPVLKKLRATIALSGTASKAHGKIAWCVPPHPRPTAIADWAAAAPPRRIDSGHWTVPGVFSADGIDPATALLIAHLPTAPAGRAADLGAGWGALAAALLARAPDLTAVDLIEADHTALEMAQRNITDPRAAFHWADATRWRGGPYDLIVSNPPFHVDRTADPALGAAFIDSASQLLRPKGRLLLVANRQLPYEAVFEANFHNWQILTSTTHYKVLTAIRPRKTRRG